MIANKPKIGSKDNFLKAIGSSFVGLKKWFQIIVKIILSKDYLSKGMASFGVNRYLDAFIYGIRNRKLQKCCESKKKIKKPKK